MEDQFDYKVQQVTISSLSGPQKWPAPHGWKFDKTQSLVWVKMVTLYRAHTKLKRTHSVPKRDIMIVDGKIEILGNILACTLGMATHFWVKAAKEFAEHFDK